jgi:hypothetical protein
MVYVRNDAKIAGLGDVVHEGTLTQNHVVVQ